MMWRTKKKTAENECGEEETSSATDTIDSATVKEETVAMAAEAGEAEAEDKKHSFPLIQSLFKRTSYKKEDAAEQRDEDAGGLESSEDKQHSDSTEASAEVGDDPHAPTKSFWTTLFGSKSSPVDDEDEDDSEAVEVEIEVEIKSDSTLQIHDNQDSKKCRSNNAYIRQYPSDPNRQSVHEEALEMLTGSLLIYIFADLREMAKQGTINAPEILSDPTQVGTVMEAIKEHKEALAERAIDHHDLQERLVALKDMHDKAMKLKQQQQQQSAAGIAGLLGKVLQGQEEGESVQELKQSVLAQFRDENATQGVVYGIAVNHIRKRVTVLFRGSVTQQDFLTDARSAQKKVPNPVHELVEEAPHRIGIHTGFYTYLFAKDDEDEEKLRWERILEDAKKLLKENPGYRLYFTGHSLGGALATLCGFYASIDDELIENGPIVIISIASPQVGHQKFVESFHALERLGRLQHLRIANKEDAITHLPFVHIKAHVFSPVAVAVWGAGNLYKHCGIHLELKSVEEENERKTEHFVCHPKSRCSEAKEVTYSDEFYKAMDAAKQLYEAMVPLRKGDFDALTAFHSCTEYEERLMASRAYLSRVTLDHLYQDESIVGRALATHLSSQQSLHASSEH